VAGPGLSAVRAALNDLGSADLQTKACVGAVVGLPALFAVSWVNTELWVDPAKMSTHHAMTLESALGQPSHAATRAVPRESCLLTCSGWPRQQ
jgi:hypothetical protein